MFVMILKEINMLYIGVNIYLRQRNQTFLGIFIPGKQIEQILDSKDPFPWPIDIYICLV